MTAVLCILLGVVLGTRFKVLCLFPVTLVSIATLALLDHTSTMSFSSTAWSALALTIELQCGYIIGAITKPEFPGMLTQGATVLEPLRDRPVRIS